uniref:Uncharacterized protein n=1 Tax=Castor canadensis TaxID=51338 RepID=A0A8C0WM14_CASCN
MISGMIKQPIRNQFKLRQNPIPPILYHQGLLWIPTSIHPSPSTSTILTRPARRPRQLHTSQPPKHPTTYETRMVLPIHVCNPTIHPQQTQLSCSPSTVNPNPSSLPTPPHIKTTKPNIPPNQPMPILSTNCRPPHPNMNRQTTCQTPIHYHWSNSINPILFHHSCPHTHCQPN